MTDAATLSPDELARRAQGRADRLTLMNWLLHLDADFQAGKVLMSREPGSAQWQQTGFLVAKGTQFCAKIGDQAYQPIGSIDEEFFYPKQSSKLVWIREFRYMEPTDTYVEPPFKVEALTQADVYEPGNPDALSDKEREKLEASFKDLGKEMQSLADVLAIGETGPIQEGEFRLLETLKLAAMGNRRLDARIRKFAIDNPELAERDANGNVVGFDFRQKTIKPMELAKIVTEFIRMKLNDDEARRYVLSHKLVPADGATYADNLAGILTNLTELLPEPGKAYDGENLARALNNARVALPVLDKALNPFINSTDLVGALTAAIAAIKIEQAKPSEAALQAVTEATQQATDAIQTVAIVPDASVGEIVTLEAPKPTGEAAPLP